MKKGRAHKRQHAGKESRIAQALGKIMPWLLSIAAIAAAKGLEHLPLFERISYVVSDHISRALGTRNANHVVLVRIGQSFSKADLQHVLSGAIPALVTDYQAAAVGVDIDFSGEDFKDLARNFAEWSGKEPELAKRVVWGVGYENTAREFENGIENSGHAETPFCEECSGPSCKVRFIPKPVFGTGNEPPNYGLAISLPDVDGVNRSSARFACHSLNEKPLGAFHFKLVEQYCGDHSSQLVTCRELKPNEQARIRINSWYKVQPMNLCRFVSCQHDLGARAGPASDELADKIVILYSDTPGNDEHMTLMSLQKGAQIVASLIENELEFGIVPRWHVSALTLWLEAGLTLLLLFLFHSPSTESWAIVISVLIFILYMYLIPRLAAWVPDFRHYVLAIILTFVIELIVKSGWHNWDMSRRLKAGTG